MLKFITLVLSSFVGFSLILPSAVLANPGGFNSGSTPTNAYVILGEDPFFVVGFDNVVQQYPIVKAIYPPPVLVGLEEKKFNVSKSRQKELVNLVKGLQNIQRKKADVSKGTFISVTGPKGRKAQAYLVPSSLASSELERSFVQRIENIILTIKDSQGSFTAVSPSCYKMQTRPPSPPEASFANTVNLPVEYSDVTNSPLYISYDKAFSLTKNNSFFQNYTVNDKVFTLSFTPVFSYQNVSC